MTTAPNATILEWMRLIAKSRRRPTSRATPGQVVTVMDRLAQEIFKRNGAKLCSLH